MMRISQRLRKMEGWREKNLFVSLIILHLFHRKLFGSEKMSIPIFNQNVGEENFYEIKQKSRMLVHTHTNVSPELMFLITDFALREIVLALCIREITNKSDVSQPASNLGHVCPETCCPSNDCFS